jgi:phytol kinase
MAFVVGKPGISAGSESLSQVVHDRLGPAEVRRRVNHMLPGFFPLLLWVIPHPHAWIVWAAVGSIIAASGVVTFRRFHCIQREAEGRTDCILAIVGYAGSVLATLLLFAPHVQVAFLVLGVLAFGDGSATLGGMLFGQRRLPWNPRKSIVGTASFLIVGVPMAAILYWGEGRTHWAASSAPEWALHLATTPMMGALLLALVTTLAAAIAESLPLRTNDNFRVGVTAAVVASLTQLLLFGWP